MWYYFKLQYKRLNRHLIDFGFNVAFGYALLTLVFVVGSFLLFEKLKNAVYYYALLAILPAYALGDVKRNEYLHQLFSTTVFQKIRLIENLIMSLPFIVFLLYQQCFIIAVVVLVVALAISFFKQSGLNTFVLPTPFYKKPFEFISGFRKSLLIFLGCYTLAIIAVSVDNFNLGAFALLVTLLICLNFYAKPEPKFYVWIHAYKPAKFLQHKMLTAFFYSIIISAPISLLLLFFYIGYWYIVVAFVLLAILYMCLNLLGKYAYYPTPVNLIQLLAVVFSLLFPPFLLISLPYFYIKAKQNLLISVL